MGFQFGIMMDLNFKISFYCFLALIIFVVIFEHITAIMEYFLNSSPIYSRMIKMVYKELMLMGLVTFGVIIFETDKNMAKTHHDYVVGIDFTHVFLFFLTFFFVSHAFYLIFISMITKQEYYRTFTEIKQNLIKKLQNVGKSNYKSWLYHYDIFPLSRIRHHVEFHLIHAVFLKTYLLPSDFNFPLYLSACFDRVALKSVNRSLFSWVLLLFIIGMNCLRHELSGSDCPSNNNQCRKLYLHYFLVCGVLLVSYTMCLSIVSRIYKSRLIHRIEHPATITVSTGNLLGRNCTNMKDIEEYASLLKSIDESKEELNSIRMDANKLKEELEKETDILEGGEEDEEDAIVRYLASLLVALTRWFNEMQSRCYVYVCIKIKKLLKKKRDRDKKDVLKRSHSILSMDGGKTFESDSDDDSEDWEPVDGTPKISEAKMNYISMKQKLKLSYYLETKRKEREIIAKLSKVSEQLNPRNHNNSMFSAKNRYHSSSMRENDGFHPIATSGSSSCSGTHYQLETMISGRSITNNSNNAVGHTIVMNDSKTELTHIKQNEQRNATTSCNIKTNNTNNSSYFWLLQPFSKRISPASSLAVSSREDCSEDIFKNIFLFDKPIWFYRAIEFQITCTCLYMALWSTNFISITSSIEFENNAAEEMYQLLMLVPIFISFYLIANVAETYSLITAASDLNTEVVYQVLVDMELMNKAVQELRDKIADKICLWAGEPNPDVFKKAEFLKVLFSESDLDGSGTVDQTEFRVMLRNLNLTYSDYRFGLVFRGLLNVSGGNANITEENLKKYFFPGFQLPTRSELRQTIIKGKPIPLERFKVQIANRIIEEEDDEEDDEEEENDSLVTSTVPPRPTGLLLNIIKTNDHQNENISTNINVDDNDNSQLLKPSDYSLPDDDNDDNNTATDNSKLISDVEEDDRDSYSLLSRSVELEEEE